MDILNRKSVRSNRKWLQEWKQAFTSVMRNVIATSKQFPWFHTLHVLHPAVLDDDRWVFLWLNCHLIPLKLWLGGLLGTGPTSLARQTWFDKANFSNRKRKQQPNRISLFRCDSQAVILSEYGILSVTRRVWYVFRITKTGKKTSPTY